MPERAIRIEGISDERIAAFRDIRERDLVGRSGFIAEGTVVVEQLLRSARFEPKSLLVLENRLAGIAPLVALLPADVPLYVADGKTFDAIAGFPVHRGVMAYGMARAATAATSAEVLVGEAAAAGGTIVVAVGIANHDNIGAIFRNAAAFGASLVLLDASCCDPLYRKALRVSVGSVLTVPFARVPTAEAALALLEACGVRCLALSPSGQEELEAMERRGPSALFLGTEGRGLPEPLMARMTTVRIAMAEGFDSLNVATSAAIALQRRFSAQAAGAGRET